MSIDSSDTHSASELTRAWGAAAPAHSLGPWPRLFWRESDVNALRERALATPGFADHMRRRADEILADPDVFASEPAWHHRHQGPIRDLATAAWLFEEERLASMSSRLLDRAASAETWVAPVHEPMVCDHVAANVGATFALSMDLLSTWLTDDHIQRYRAAAREKCLDPFLRACRGRETPWARRDCVSNWRIMTCGDAGLAGLGTAHEEDDLNEILAHAVEGVVDILGTIPEDGDYVEGPHYFVATLGMGLRFLRALCRLRPDVERHLHHPRLAGVADYLLHVTEPDGRVFDYFDNGLDWSADERATMLLLAAMQRRGDLAQLARSGDTVSLTHLVWDAPDVASSPPSGSTSAHFRTSGLVTCRSEWSETATYVGFRSGPNTFGHSHLDCGGFVISSGPTRLAVDEGVWPYAHFLGFFDTAERRWTFDANDTIGHNTLLIDGRGQLCDEAAPGRIARYVSAEHGTVAVADMSDVYGDLVDECVRWLVYLPPDTVVVFDRVRSATPRRAEWLLHHRGEIGSEDDDDAWAVRVGDTSLTVNRLLRDDADPWRVSDVSRATHYVESNGLTRQRRSIRYRAWGPIRAKTQHDLLAVLTVGEPAGEASATVTSESVEVTAAGRRVSIQPASRNASIAAAGDGPRG